MSRRKNIFLAGCASPAFNAVLILAAARGLEAKQLTIVATSQFIIMTGVGINRAFVLNPSHVALGARPDCTSLPVRFLFSVSCAVGLAIGAAAGVFAYLQGASATSVLLVALIPTVLNIYDACRFREMIASSGRRILIADGLSSTLGAVVLASIAFTKHGDGDPVIFLWIWLITIAIGLAIVIRRLPSGSQVPKSEVLALGRWSGLDAAISGISGLVPFVFTAFDVNSTLAGTYRVLQSVVGPLNIISTTMLTLAGLESDKLNTLEALNEVERGARKTAIRLSVVALVSASAAAPICLAVAGISLSNQTGPVLITVACCVLGAATIPYSAATLALGGHRYGFYLRLLVLAGSLSITFVAQHSGSAVDTIGLVSLFASLSSLVGWRVFARRSLLARVRRVEVRYLRDTSEVE